MIPPISPYGTFTGELFQYTSPFPSLVAFESSPSSHLSSITTSNITTTTPTFVQNNNNNNDDQYNGYKKKLNTKKCILIGGLSDGLIPTPYSKQLECACHENGWSLIQLVLSSSYLGFGNGSLERDTQEINKLMTYLHHHRGGEEFALVGHSTGCQNSVHFLKHGDNEYIRRTKLVVLQAPVSDREGAMLESSYNSNIKHARSLVDNQKGDEMMPRKAFWSPITAQRFLSLQDCNGKDDFFSSDLSDDQLVDRLGHVGKIYDNDDDNYNHDDNGDTLGEDLTNKKQHLALRVLVAFSGKDEYVPDHVDKDLLLKRLCGAMIQKGLRNNDHDHDNNNSTNNIYQNGKVLVKRLMLDKGNHNLSKGQGELEKFVNSISSFLRDI
eukprot:CAMPEP_0184861362 /NCGR_PEP_ID=MMETSP0580-20130426/6065_1 /TAXON_ID=1118495 /ORGANISM="Dactyliosolen fragilissimus" /LENGTH=381 /DNA_ID=CAMNT_0027358835 /DNA_START=379 /DNA_END=1524 /DNA_ORIENTATION=+